MRASGNDTDKVKQVFFDGSCPMCVAIIGKIEDSTQGETFDMQDITKAVIPGGFTRQDVEREIHVIDSRGRLHRNADAILEILSEYRVWKSLVWFGRLAPVRPILRLGYNFIAANRHFLFGSAARIYWTKVTVALGFIAGIALSLKLWVSTRLYPLTPVVDIFPPIPHPLDWVILLLLLGLLAGVILHPRPRLWIWGAVVLVSALVFLDQSRLQPWVFQYAFMLAVLGLFSWKFDEARGGDVALNSCRLIVASIYFWSGLQKMNIYFLGHVFPWMVMPITQLLPASIQPILFLLGLFVPFVEIGIGLALLTRRFRNLAVYLALCMCIFVLWTIGPWGHNWNSVVWPWNIAMVALVFILFFRTEGIVPSRILWIRDSFFHKGVLLLFGFLPLLYFFNHWDSYPSWSLYSGTTSEAVIYLNNDTALMISDWSFDELNVPPYPEMRIYKNIARHVCKTTDDSREMRLVTTGRRTWFNNEGEQSFKCADLSK